jgi:hypothetical protein
LTRKPLFFLLMLTVLLAGLVGWGGAAPAARAQTPAPVMAVTPAFDGYFKYGEWLPLYVSVENSGGDMEAELRVRVTGTGNNVFAAPVSLPSGARKLVPLYVLPNNFTRVLEVQLVSQEQLVASAKVSVRPQINLSYFAGIIAPERGALTMLSGLSTPGVERPKVVVDIALDQLPERWEGLASFDLLVINATDTSKMTPAQASALQTWVEKGGRLVLGGGSGAAATLAGIPEGLRPVSLQGSTEVQQENLDGLVRYAQASKINTPGPFVAAQAAPQDWVVWASDGSLPLLVERGVGSGRVFFSALDLAGPPFDGWPGTQQFWYQMAGQYAEYNVNLPQDSSVRQMRSSSFYGAVSNIPTMALPSIQGLSILLGVYILLVGPINYLILRRARRLHLAWVTIPAITLAFTAGAFGLGYLMRGNDLILNKVAIVEIPSSGPALVNSYVGLFSPRQQSYAVEVQGDGLVSPGDSSGYYGGPEMNTAGQEMVFVQGRPSLVQGITVNQWAMQRFTVEDTWPELGRLTGKVEIQGDVLRGTVKNETSVALTEVVVLVNRRYQMLGSLAPGEEKTVDLGIGGMTRDMYGPSLSYKLYMEPLSAQGGQMSRDVQLKTTILDNALDGPPWANISQSANAQPRGIPRVVVMGWADQSPPAVGVRGQEATEITTALLYGLLPLSLPEDGRVTIPPGLIPGEFASEVVNYGKCGPMTSTSVYLDNAEMVFRFQIPTDLAAYQVEGLNLALAVDNPTAKLKEYALYDWIKEDWTPINSENTNSVLIRNTGAYINDNGEVRVRLTAGAGGAGCYFLDLGVEAAKALGKGN